jgi:hypothetical protein
VDPPKSEGPAQAPDGAVQWVEPNIVDRPGVPASLYDKYWVLGNQAGHVGTTARIVLSPSEQLMAADAGLVASYPVERNEDGSTAENILGPNGAVITVRDIRSGAVIRMIESTIEIRDSVMVGSVLFYAGETLPVEGRIDAGIWVVDAADPESSPRAIIEPSDLHDEYGKNASRLRLSVTDGGRVVRSAVAGETSRVTQAIDVGSLAPLTIASDEAVLDLAGGTALVRRSDALALVELQTGRTVGPTVGAAEVYRSFPGTNEVYAQYAPGPEPGVYISAISLESGKPRQLLYQGPETRTTYISPELSTPDLLVMFDDDWQLGSDGSAFVQINLLDTATGELEVNAFAIGNP